ncbi:MAG: HEPN domain-containing protein [Rhodoglobus sp.]
MTSAADSEWDRARRCLESAELLLDSGDPDSAASRAYYAVFHAATAFFLGEGAEFGKHEAVESAIHRDLVRTGRIPREIGSSYSAMRELRLVGDYGLDENVTAEDARDALQQAARFLTVLQALAEKQSG